MEIRRWIKVIINLGIGSGTFKIPFSSFKSNGMEILRPTKVITSRLGEWSIYSIIKSKAVIIDLGNGFIVIDPSEETINEIAKHIK